MKQKICTAILVSLLSVSLFGREFGELYEFEKDFFGRFEPIPKGRICFSSACLKEAFSRFETKKEVASYLYELHERDLESTRVVDTDEYMILSFSVVYPLESRIVRLSLLFEYAEDDSILAVDFSRAFLP